MLKIKRLYSEPELFDPIEFHDGINLILGQTNESSEKTNGVGKSLFIEFINFCLLKAYSESRVAKIPVDAFPHDTLICLDFTIHGKPITSKRCIANYNCPSLIIERQATDYINIKDATNPLIRLLFGSAVNDEHPSFRGILAPLIRDERSEFKSLIKCHDTAKNIPADHSPHLFLLGINPALYHEARALQKDIDDTTKARTKLKKEIEWLTGKSFKEANSDLNELTGQVEQIKVQMDTLENAQSFELIRDDIIALEQKLDIQRIHSGTIKSELAKLTPFKGDNYVDDSEIADLYGRFKASLGDIIRRELTEVTEFKRKIDTFQRTLIDARKKSLQVELSTINKNIKVLDHQYKEKLAIIDKDGVLKSLKITVSAYQQKLEEHARLSSFINKYNEYEQHIKLTKQERSSKITLLDALVNEAEPIKTAFEQTILSLHSDVMGNRRCSFNIEISDKKEIVNDELRIHDDGSHSNEREKVFFYDIAMLLTPEVDPFHPGLLVHDNIFDVDQDTLVKSLDYLADHAEALSGKQYILTINSDKLHPDELAVLKMDLRQYQRAAFTKSDRFIRKHYQEL